MKTQSLLIGLLGIMALSETTYAEEVNFGKQAPSASQVIEALSPAVVNSEPEAVDPDYEGDINQNGRSRSIDMSSLDGSPKAVKKAQNKKVKKEIHGHVEHKADVEIAMSMEILFGYKSAELTDMAKEQLKPVGEALASEKLQGLDFIVEGHTDAIGGSDYNKNLSKERAESVKQFLVDTYRIDGSRIQVVGKGKSNLLDPTNPSSEINRRVRIIATK